MQKSPMKIATVQFENKSNDKEYNLAKIDELTGRAAREGAQVAVFHECSITGYTFARDLNKEEMEAIAETIPEGPSTQRLMQIAKKAQHGGPSRPL
eukprot:TRINITY_DN5819_c0_g1_i2.p2 TRINITY_DN5819_c0_g1~~TRINITY_DN5819_c0_g1_i2.p2  ORF type:complete len:110 (+),score=39.45 TRINITY_DN5819_c0_g1_i2:45-332(+)